jgi:type II secretory pathway pseudopilin PulG
MERRTVKNKAARAFTIVELLTVMSIIIVLISLLVPAVSRVRQYAKRVKQNAQFHSIAAALEMFTNEFEGYPDSGPMGLDVIGGEAYCGAMKLAEALVGQDMRGFHPNSRFRANGKDDGGNWLYVTDPDAAADIGTPAYTQNLRARKGPFLELEGANAYSLSDMYTDPTPFPTGYRVDDLGIPKTQMVLCDEYPRVSNIFTGVRIGMPVLYYKADVSKLQHDATLISESVYDARDNQNLVDKPLPWDLNYNHPMATAGVTPDNAAVEGLDLFYKMTRDENVPTVGNVSRPRRPDSYILMSAGYDGLYGTDDDVFNFGE